MGKIAELREQQLSGFIKAGDLIRYIAYLEKESYQDVARFLLNTGLAQQMLHEVYQMQDDYCIAPIHTYFDNQTGITWGDEYNNFDKADANTIPYSIATKDFLYQAINTGDISENLYFKKSYTTEFLNNLLGDNLPDIDVTLSELSKQTEQQTINTEQNNISATVATFNEQPPALKAANKAFNIFWGNAHPAEPDTHPINKTVIAWLVTQDISPTKAKQIAEIIRPDWAAKGRRSDK